MQASLQSTHVENKETPVMSVLFLLLMTICGAILGIIVFFVSQWVYLPIIFPIALSIIGIGINVGISKRFVIFNPWMLLVAGVLFSIVLYGTFHYAIYLHLRQQLVHDAIYSAANQNRAITPAEAELFVDRALYRHTGASGFLGVLNLRAEAGLGLQLYVGQLAGAPINYSLKGALVWLYWITELAICIFFAYTYTRPMFRIYESQKLTGSVSGRHVCEKCGGRYVKESVGAIPAGLAASLRDALNAKDYPALGLLVFNYDYGTIKGPRFDVLIEHCDKCNESNSILRLILEHTEKPSEIVATTVLTPDEQEQIVQNMPKSVTDYKSIHLS